MSDKLTEQQLQSLRNLGCEFEAAADEICRLTAEQAVMRQWIAEALPVLASIDDCEDMEPLRALVESGRRLVDGGPDDLLAGVE